MRALEVLDLRGLAVFEDRGRGHRASGVPVSGAFDRSAHRAATRLVGGDPADATVEIAGTITLRSDVRCTVAVTGRASTAIDGSAAPAWTSLDLPAGASIEVASPARAYLAVAGGFRPAPVLGSRSTCLLGPLGPAAITPGDRLPLAAHPRSGTEGDYGLPPPADPVLRVVAGPHLDLPECALTVVEGSRVGLRARPSVHVAAAAGLPSLGVLPGAIQVLPSGDWMILGPDAGTMGGYQVIAVVCTADLDRVAQLVTGDVVLLMAVPPDRAPAVHPIRVVRASRL